MWVVIIGAIIDSDSSRDKNNYLRASGGPYLLSGRDLQDQTARNKFEVQDSRNPAYFVLVSEDDAICMLVCTASQTHVHYSKVPNKKLAEVLPLEEVTIQVYSVLVGLGTCVIEHVAGGALKEYDTILTLSLRATT